MNAERYEKLLEILDNACYSVDTATGTVFGTKGQMLKAGVSSSGYENVILCKEGKCYNYTVHEIVAASAGYDILNKIVNHIDGNKRNNQASNLECITQAQNVQHAYDTELKKAPAGENHYRAKLTAADVQVIRVRYAAGGVTYQTLADEFGVDISTISYIITRKTWQH